MFENIMKFFKKAKQDEDSKLIGNSSTELNSKTNVSAGNKTSAGTSAHSRAKAKERLHLVLVQDRVNVSADFLDLMKQEIIGVIKKYIDIDEEAMDVSLTNRENEDGTKGTPALYANIPILNIKDETRKMGNKIELKKIEDKENPPKKEQENIERNSEEDNTEKEENKEDCSRKTNNKKDERGNEDCNIAKKVEQEEKINDEKEAV